jgi:glutamate-1-semialdehyde 2,1-aminomutase
MLSPLVGSDRYFDKNENPILFNRGIGSSIFDQSNNEYTDFVLGLGPVILGHSDTEFVNRLTVELAKGLSFPGFSQVHTDLADVYESVYLSHKVVTTFKTSSEAVTAAIRCSMLETGRKKIIRCGFLGWHDAQIANTPSWHEWPGSNKRLETRFKQGMRGIEGTEEVFNWVDGELNTLASILNIHGADIAAFAIDIYQLAFIPMDVFLKALDLCAKQKIKIILDETKTAGRTNSGGLIDVTKIPADYIILGKAVGNGLPLSVLLGKPENISIYREARIGGTHTKETLSANAGIIVADIMQQRDGYSRIKNICLKVVNTFNNAICASNTSEYLKAISLLEQTLFDLKFSEDMINNFSARELLKSEFISHGIFVLQGHNSFICLAHESIDFDLLEAKLYSALVSWKSKI